MHDQSGDRSPEYWRNMAEEARTMAEGLSTEANRKQMFAIAENYERLAEQAQREQERIRAAVTPDTRQPER